MINGADGQIPGWTPDKGDTRPELKSIVTAQHLAECTRALGRPLDPFEYKVLEEMAQKLDEANLRLVALGQHKLVKSVDELVHVFTEPVKIQEKAARKHKKQFGYTGGLRDIGKPCPK